MSENIQSYVPDSLARTTVNQYGDRSVHIDQADNLTINYFTNQNSEAFDDDGKPLTPLSPTRYDKTSGTIYLGNEQIRLPCLLYTSKKDTALNEVTSENEELKKQIAALQKQLKKNNDNQ